MFDPYIVNQKSMFSFEINAMRKRLSERCQKHALAKHKRKKVKEKSRECHNHKPQPFPDTKRKRKQTKPNKRKSNKRTKRTKISSLFRKRGNGNAQSTEKNTRTT